MSISSFSAHSNRCGHHISSNQKRPLIQITVRPCPLKLDISFSTSPINQKPVTFDMAFSAAGILSAKRMVFICFTQVLTRPQHFGDLFKQAHVVAALLHQINIFFELPCENQFIHRLLFSLPIPNGSRLSSRIVRENVYFIILN